jgi:hypothetical protein
LVLRTTGTINIVQSAALAGAGVEGEIISALRECPVAAGIGIAVIVIATAYNATAAWHDATAYIFHFGTAHGLTRKFVFPDHNWLPHF